MATSCAQCSLPATTGDGTCSCYSTASVSSHPDRQFLGFTSLIVGCLASPCCAPLLVAGGLAYFAGTPVALVLAQYTGWVYAGLTLLSMVSFVLGLRWLQQRRSHAPTSR